MTKITLNADKRKMIADIFQNHFEQQPSKAKIDFQAEELKARLEELKIKREKINADKFIAVVNPG
jgi:hypothetical protein